MGKLAVLLLLALIAFMVFFCRLYSWHVFKWNFLSCTPYRKATHKPDPQTWNNNDVTVTWIGHSTVLINLCGTTILTDPVLVKRIAPIHLGWHVNSGIRRISELPLKFSDLPPIDIILLSHAHYDHWDIASLKYFGNSTTAVIPLGTKDLIPKGHFGNVIEMAWQETRTVGPVKIAAFEINHWGKRHSREKAKRSYNGYIVSACGRRIIFFGDTAFKIKNKADLKKEINWAVRTGGGPFDICLIPIGAYFYRIHLSPEEAWSLFNQIKGRFLLPIHWGTFILTPPDKEPPWEAMERLKKIAVDDKDRIICDEQGKVFVLPGRKF